MTKITKTDRNLANFLPTVDYSSVENVYLSCKQIEKSGLPLPRRARGIMESYEQSMAYITQSEIRLKHNEWESLSVEEKDKEVLYAIKLIDGLPWVGKPLKIDQHFSWPRKEFEYMEPRSERFVKVAEGTIPSRLKFVIESIVLDCLKNPSNLKANGKRWQDMAAPLLKERWWCAAIHKYVYL